MDFSEVIGEARWEKNVRSRAYLQGESNGDVTVKTRHLNVLASPVCLTKNFTFPLNLRQQDS